VSIKACDNVCTDALIRTDHVPVLFGIELGGEFCGVYEVTEHHGQLAAFGFGRGRGDWGGCDPGRLSFPRSRWGWRCWRCVTASRPDQDGSRLVAGYLFGLNEFGLEVFEVLVIQGKAAFEGAIGEALFLLEQVQDLG
jgi:hypothetical protein